MKFEKSIYLSKHHHNQDIHHFHFLQKFSSIPVSNPTTSSPKQLWICFLLLQIRSVFSGNYLQEVIFTEHTMCLSLWIISLYSQNSKREWVQEGLTYSSSHSKCMAELKFQSTSVQMSPYLVYRIKITNIPPN